MGYQHGWTQQRNWVTIFIKFLLKHDKTCKTLPVLVAKTTTYNAWKWRSAFYSSILKGQLIIMEQTLTTPYLSADWETTEFHFVRSIEVQTPWSLQCAGPLLCIPGTTARHQGTTKFCLCVPRSSETHTLYQFINCTGTFVAVFGFRQQIVSNTSYQCVDTNSWFQHVWNAPSGAVALRPRQGDCQELEEDCPRFWIEIVAGSQF